jgi:putative phosphoesterase
MKALIMSDIHSNIVALEAIWAREHDADAIYCAGDLVDYGPRPREVLDWVRAHNVVCVQGNHDRHVAATWAEDDLWRLPDGALHWRHHNARRLVATDAHFLAALPEAVTFNLDGIQYGMTHGYRDYDLILHRHAYRAFCAQRFPGVTIDRLVLGHTHRQAVMVLGKQEQWLNPGSVSYRRPDDPDQEAHYMVIEDGQVALRSVPYDAQAVYREVIQQPLTEDELRVTRWFFGPRGGSAAGDRTA